MKKDLLVNNVSIPPVNVATVLDSANSSYGTKLLNGGFTQGELVTHMALPNRGFSYFMFSKYMDVLRQTTPGTVERYRIATALLRYLGYSVKYDGGDVCPEVFWFNTEGTGDDEAAMIDSILNKDYSAIVKELDLLPEPKELMLVKALLNKSDAPPSVVIFDSITQKSTD